MFEKQTILIADDSPENIDLLNHVLSDEYRVKVANTGEKALSIAYSDDPPDLILLDIMMPGISGYEVCRRLKANPDRRMIPVIFVTSMTSMDDERLGLELGAVDYITKPISPPIVQARVRTHLALYDQTRELERMVKQRTKELIASRQQVIHRLGRAAEFKDNETGNHVVRMSHSARLIAEDIGLGPEMANVIFTTSPMHDIGKIGIADRILLKPEALDPDEWVEMRKHPEIGAAIIGQHGNTLLDTARTIALTHHERWDGKGYPFGLKGDAIPQVGRIVAIADVFDALVSQRPYKNAFTVEHSLALMDEETGRHFDPILMQSFHRVLPRILKIKEMYADERGNVSDLDLDDLMTA